MILIHLIGVLVLMHPNKGRDLNSNSALFLLLFSIIQLMFHIFTSDERSKKMEDTDREVCPFG